MDTVRITAAGLSDDNHSQLCAVTFAYIIAPPEGRGYNHRMHPIHAQPALAGALRFCRNTLLLMLLLMVAGHAQRDTEATGAEDAEPLLIERSWDFGIGIGYGELSNPFIGADNVPAYLAIDLTIYGERFFFDNGDLGFTLVNQQNFGLNLLATYTSDRIFHSFFDPVGIATTDFNGNTLPDVATNPMLVPLDEVAMASGPGGGQTVVPIELPDRNFAINLGVELLLSGDWGELDVQLTQDVSGAHSGQELWVEYGRGWRWGPWSLRPSVGINWKSAKLVDYYYAVLPEENVILSSLYTGQSTFNAFAGIAAAYQLTDHWSLVGSFRYERLGTHITESPLIVEDSLRNVFIGTFYRF